MPGLLYGLVDKAASKYGAMCHEVRDIIAISHTATSADLIKLAVSALHDQIKDPNEREHVYEGLKKVRALALSAVSAIGEKGG